EMVVLAKQVGFSLAETRTILTGFSEEAPPSDVWCRLAKRKLPEVERTLAEARAMKAILETGLRCECLSLVDCLGRVGSVRRPPARASRRRRHSPSGT
ncbi:MAG: MerR family DNA-binding protein, partial [Solirubrobacterales bacterium]